jgi:hypothetical protein
MGGFGLWMFLYIWLEGRVGVGGVVQYIHYCIAYIFVCGQEMIGNYERVGEPRYITYTIYGIRGRSFLSPVSFLLFVKRGRKRS